MNRTRPNAGPLLGREINIKIGRASYVAVSDYAARHGLTIRAAAERAIAALVEREAVG